MLQIHKYTDSVSTTKYSRSSHIYKLFQTRRKIAYLLGEHKTCCVFAAQYVSLCHHRREDTPSEREREREREREIERERELHAEFCKSILRVQRNTPNNACRAELRQYPLMMHIEKRAIKFWKHLKMSDPNSYHFKALKNMK